MAGVRQHILPRFLLKGFSSRTHSDKVFTWVYRKGEIPFETNIENVSVEKHFYGRDGELSADDEITRLETDYSKLIAELRNKTSGEKILNTKIAEFVSHLSIRAKHIRTFFLAPIDDFFRQVDDYLSDFNNLKTLLLNNPDLMIEELNKALGDHPLLEWQKDLLPSLVENLLSTLSDEQKNELQVSMKTLIAEIRSFAPEGIRQSHIKSLIKNPVSKPRSSDYQRLNWFVFQTKETLICGDIGGLFEINGKRRFKPLDDMGDEIVGIYLPIASHKIVFATPYNFPTPIDVKTINKAIARCSYEYFVCGEHSENKKSLLPLIGHWAGIMNKKELEDLLAKTIREMKSGPL